jgi:carboxylesterase
MEGKFPVIKGAEPFYFMGNEVGILISHGFSGTPQSVRFLGEKIAQFGYSVLGPRLKGHGTNYYDLEKCTHDEWFASLVRGYKELKKRCSNIFVIGQSMGGTLSLSLAHKYPEIKGIILINPALSIPTFEYLKEKSSPRFIEDGSPDIKAKDVFEIAYHKTPLKAIHELQKLMKITPALLPNINCPVLGFKSSEDHVVPPENTDYIIENIGSEIKKTVVLRNSYHVASMDNEKEEIVKHCHHFIQQQIGRGVLYH